MTPTRCPASNRATHSLDQRHFPVTISAHDAIVTCPSATSPGTSVHSAVCTASARTASPFTLPVRRPNTGSTMR